VDDGSFEAFVTEASTELLRTGYLLTNDRAQARDLLQTALMTAQRHWDQLTDPLAYARRQLVGTHTGWQRRLRVGDLLAESPLVAGASGLPGFTTGVRADPGPRTELATALAALPPRLRAALVLRYGAELSEAGTADALGSTVEEARDAVVLGLERLAELLPGDGDPAGRLRAELPAQAAAVTADPGQAAALALDGARDRRHHLAGLAALAAFAVLVVLVVALSL
jgi:DNA-directed RNA polymerase specialized sigma24 family protein